MRRGAKTLFGCDCSALLALLVFFNFGDASDAVFLITSPLLKSAASRNGLSSVSGNESVCRPFFRYAPNSLSVSITCVLRSSAEVTARDGRSEAEASSSNEAPSGTLRTMRLLLAICRLAAGVAAIFRVDLFVLGPLGDYFSGRAGCVVMTRAQSSLHSRITSAYACSHHLESNAVELLERGG